MAAERDKWTSLRVPSLYRVWVIRMLGARYTSQQEARLEVTRLRMLRTREEIDMLLAKGWALRVEKVKL